MRHSRQDEDDSTEYVIIERRAGGGAGLFVAGLAVGAALALLLAPRTGAETRAGITRGARRMRAAAGGSSGAGGPGPEAGSGLARGVVALAREAVAQRVESAKQAVELKATQVSRAYAAGRAAAQQAREDLERRIAAQRDLAGGSRADGASPAPPAAPPTDRAREPLPPATGEIPG